MYGWSFYEKEGFVSRATAGLCFDDMLSFLCCFLTLVPLSLAFGIVLALLLESLGLELIFMFVDSALKLRLKELTELISKL